MTSHRRPANIAIPRQIAMHLTRELTKAPLKEIGEAFGGRDHGTVIHACKSVAKKVSSDEDFRRTVASLVEKAAAEGASRAVRGHHRDLIVDVGRKLRDECVDSLGDLRLLVVQGR
jgi:hypothetical protein